MTGLSPRTIRYYVAQGLIPAAHGRGPTATYDQGHIHRLKAIQKLKNERMGLNAIRRRLSGMSDRQLASLLDSGPRPHGETWLRIELLPNIELHVRSLPMPEGNDVEEAVKDILDAIRPTLERIERLSGSGQIG